MIKDNTFECDNHRIVEFEYPIQKCLDLGEVLIVLLRTPYKTLYNENVFGISRNGERLWQVQKNIEYPSGSKDCPFTDVFLNKNNELVLYNWCDLAFVVNPNSGEILKKYEHR